MDFTLALQLTNSAPPLHVTLRQWAAVDRARDDRVCGFQYLKALGDALSLPRPSEDNPGLFELCYSGVVDLAQRKTKRRRVFVLDVHSFLLIVRGAALAHLNKALIGTVIGWLESNEYKLAPSGSEVRQRQSRAKELPLDAQLVCAPAGACKRKTLLLPEKNLPKRQRDLYACGFWMENHVLSDPV